jgi:Uma2 family endonuclease
VSAAALEHPIGPTTVEDWLAQEHPSDGSRLELIYGYLHVTPPPSAQHQYSGDELRAVIKTALREGHRSDLYAVTGVGVKISTAWRTGLIPDLVVMKVRPVAVSVKADDLVLVVEVWSPSNSRTERETKMAAYAGAGVPYFWAVNQDRIGASTVTAYYLKNGRYVEELAAGPGTIVTIKVAAPVPVTFDPRDLGP